LENPSTAASVSLASDCGLPQELWWPRSCIVATQDVQTLLLRIRNSSVFACVGPFILESS
jgi:hypothetical protein